MVTSVAELVVARTADTIVAAQLATLAGEEFPVASWEVGGAARDLLKADATALAWAERVVASLVMAAFLDDAEGDWLTLLAASRFSTARVLATYTAGNVVLTVASGAGPYTIGAGALLVTDGVRRWRSTNTSSVTVTSAATVTIEVRAESAGTSYNVAANTITRIVSPASAGLSVNNPSSSWITTQGTDDELDASLRARCRARWATLGRGANLSAYLYWATTSSATTVTRAKVVPGAGDGTLTIYVAQATSAASGGQVSVVQAYVDLQKPVTDTVTVLAATASSVQIIGTVTFSAASYNTTDAQTAISNAITAYVVSKAFGDTIDLGGLYRAIYDATPGVSDVDISFPTGDTVLGVDRIGAVASISLTYSP